MIRNLWLTFKRNYLLTPLAMIGKYGTKALYSTCQFEVKGLEQFLDIASKEKCILMVWHNRLALIAEFFCHFAPNLSFAAFISKSRDGEPVSRLVESYKGGSSIRVPHNQRYEALQLLIERLKQGKEVIIITPDGPKGPRYKVKPGIIVAAKEAQASIVPFTWESDRFWQLNSWDRFRIPKPFSKITIILGNPVIISQEINNREAALILENSMKENEVL